MSEQPSLTYSHTLVPPKAIDRELVRIWREAADLDTKADTKGRGARVKTTLSNFVMLTARSSAELDVRRIDALITDFCVSHPSRFFVIEYDPEFKARDGSNKLLETAVSSRCVLADSGQHICSEEVYITVGNGGIPLIANILMSLFVRDVDIITLLLCDAAGPKESKPKAGANLFQTLLETLRSLSHSVFYDSQDFADQLQSYAELGVGNVVPDPGIAAAPGMLATPGSLDTRPRLRDLTWFRQRRWRTLIAEQFDSERVLAHLPELQRVEFAWAGESAVIPPKTIVLSSWVLGCLGVKLLEVSAITGVQTGFECTAERVAEGLEGKSIVISFHRNPNASKAASERGSVCSVKFTFGGDEIVHLVRDFSDASISMTHSFPAAKDSTEGSLTRKAPFPVESTESILGDMFSSGADPVFERTLNLIRDILPMMGK